jgi:hypothetical protein
VTVAVLQASGVSDILTAGLAELGEGKWTDLSFDLQSYFVLPDLTKKDRISIQSGHSIQWDIITDENYSFGMSGLYDVDNVDVRNGLTQGSIPWRHSKCHYAFDHREVDMNEGARQIVNLIKARRHMAMVSQANGMELKFFRAPSSSADTEEPYGLPYWVVKSASTGFVGDVPSGHTTVANVSTTTYPRWKNYAAPYTAVTKDDLVQKLRTAMEETTFVPPVQSATFNTGDRYKMLTTLSVRQAMENLLEDQNENLGGDLDKYHNQVMFRSVPLIRVPRLDEDTTNPVYGINHGEFKTVILKSRWMKETVISQMPGQHNVSAVFIDSSWNWICRNRRRNFVISNGTTMPA